MNTQPNTPASRNEEAVKEFLEAQDALDNREYAGINGESYDVLMRRRNAARRDLDAALAAPGAAIDAGGQDAKVPDGWCIDREPRNVLALYRTGTAQPYRFEPGEAMHAFLLSLLGGCPECGGRLEFEEGEAWDGPSVGCVECGSHLASRPEAPPASASPATVAKPVEWQPLSTAPDGVRVLLGPREAPVVGIVRQMPEWADEQEPVASVIHYNGTVLVAGYHCSEWCPLPAAQPCASQGCGGAAATALSCADVDRIVYACRQSGDDSTYAIVNAAIRAALSTAKSGGGATPEGGGE